jgi:hypothetical protein
MWQKNPPSYDQWLGQDNDGYWWIKTTIPKDDDFPEFCLYDIVCILFEPDRADGLGKRKGRLVFQYQGRSIYCNDLPSTFQDRQWQPVAPYTL